MRIGDDGTANAPVPSEEPASASAQRHDSAPWEAWHVEAVAITLVPCWPHLRYALVILLSFPKYTYASHTQRVLLLAL